MSDDPAIVETAPTPSTTVRGVEFAPTRLDGAILVALLALEDPRVDKVLSDLDVQFFDGNKRLWPPEET